MKLLLNSIWPARAVHLVILGTLTVVRAIAADVEVPRWEPHDFVFTAGNVAGNPFQIAFSADLTGPDGVKLAVPGFHDGGSTWKVRVSAPTEGKWSLVTHSDVPALDGQRATFLCTAGLTEGMHGSLRVDPERPHAFVYDDGTRFLPVGYECDWLWALDVGDPELKTITPFLDKLTAHGFNFVILNAYAHDTSWRKGRTGDDDFGPPALYAWEGTNEAPDHSRFNLAYWQHYDRVIAALHARGIWAHVLMKVYNKQVKWPANGSAEDDQYFRWLIARYSAYPNITWDLAKEAHYEKDLNYKLGRLRFIRATDPYHRLITVHDDRENYDHGVYDTLLDYRSDQQHQDWRAVMQAHLEGRTWPVINTEFGYEHGPGGLTDKTYKVVQSPEEVIRRAWEVYVAGGFGAHYYTHTAWDVVRPQDTPPGYAYFQHLRNFFEHTSYWRMRPIDGLSSAGSCLAEPGREYVVFLAEARPFTLTIDGASSPLSVEWYHPLTGARQRAGELGNGVAQLVPPAEWGGGPVALHVGAERREVAWRSLLDEKLSQWEFWMGSPHQSVEGLPTGTAKSANARGNPPMGLGNDPKHVFSVRMDAGEPVLHVTGEIWGGLTTLESFSNYHLRLDVRWAEKKWEPRLTLPRNSGLLYHSVGPHGAFWNTWKRSLEFEIQENDMGDLYPLGGGRGDVTLVKLPSKIWTYDPAGERTTVGSGVKEQGGNRAAHIPGNFEKPNGEWNTLELYTIGQTAVHVVNGHIVNVIQNTAQIDGPQAEVLPLEAGQLQLQSESAEVEYRRIEISPLTVFPAHLQRAVDGRTR